MPLVETEYGTLNGVIIDNNGDKYIAFKGIPYAKPPIGNLRFKAPEPPEPWQGIRDASEHGPVCPQYNERMDRIDPGSENCLHLNVYTPSIQPTLPLPVMVWIHGGAFYTGSGNSDFYGPEFFMSYGVILVTFNYRLEVLGFLCLDCEEVPGNAGLKDQVAALKWVKNNIDNFGGDSNNITIFGCSAGSAATSYHLVSDMSKGLFNKAICQSGVCLNEWSYNIHARPRAFQLGKQLGKDTVDPSELLEFLRNVPTLSLVNIKLSDTNLTDLADSILFGPVIEKSHLKVEKFIAEDPTNLVRKGQIANVPVIIGYTSGEGIEIARSLINLMKFLNTPGAVVPRELKLNFPKEKIEDMDKRIRRHYFRGEEISMQKIQEVVDLQTDLLFLYNIRRFALCHTRHCTAPVYFYKFTAESDRNYCKKKYNMGSAKGVCHADELHYLFNVTCLDLPLTEESKGIIQVFVRLWTNFASKGNPTPTNNQEQWKPFTESKQYCYIIGKKLECVQNDAAENMKFWDEIYEGN